MVLQEESVATLHLAPKHRRMLVVLLRHGEREDEVMNPTQRHRLSASRRLDPALTPLGHKQAREAWAVISSALSSTKPKKVAIFTSPLRRAVGTAMMVSETFLENWKVSLPSNCSENENGEGNNDDRAATREIPIVIWNGLCDCAAQINRLGGHRNAIETGYISCAASEYITPHTFSETSMAKTWGEMTEAAMESTPMNSARASPYPIRFWKSSPYKNNEVLVPMTPRLHLERQGGPPSNRESAAGKSLVDPTSSHTVQDPIDGEQPIDHVVRQALMADCDVCIIVSHREEIRDLYKYRCQQPELRKHLPYCCVGVFSVSMEHREECRDSLHLNWRFHDIKPYKDLTAPFVEAVISQL